MSETRHVFNLRIAASSLDELKSAAKSLLSQVEKAQSFEVLHGGGGGGRGPSYSIWIEYPLEAKERAELSRLKQKYERDE